MREDTIKTSTAETDVNSITYYAGSPLDINNIPSWFPRASLSKTQTDLIAISPNGEKNNIYRLFYKS